MEQTLYVKFDDIKSQNHDSGNEKKSKPLKHPLNQAIDSTSWNNIPLPLKEMI